MNTTSVSTRRRGEQGRIRQHARVVGGSRSRAIPISASSISMWFRGSPFDVSVTNWSGSHGRLLRSACGCAVLRHRAGRRFAIRADDAGRVRLHEHPRVLPSGRHPLLHLGEQRVRERGPRDVLVRRVRPVPHEEARTSAYTNAAGSGGDEHLGPVTVAISGYHAVVVAEEQGVRREHCVDIRGGVLDRTERRRCADVETRRGRSRSPRRGRIRSQVRPRSSSPVPATAARLQRRRVRPARPAHRRPRERIDARPAHADVGRTR